MNALSHYKTKKVSQSCWVSLLLCPVLAHAGPQGAQVVSGQAVVIQSSQGGQSVPGIGAPVSVSASQLAMHPHNLAAAVIYMPMPGWS